MNADWVREIVCAWIERTDDVEVLRDWNHATGERLRRLDQSMTRTERTAHQITHSPERWLCVELRVVSGAPRRAELVYVEERST